MASFQFSFQGAMNKCRIYQEPWTELMAYTDALARVILKPGCLNHKR
jgi:hypothetical protein